MKEKTEMIECINTSDKCFAAIINDENYSEVIFIKVKKFYKNMLVLSVNKKVLNTFDNAVNPYISVTIWHKIKGYQLKGFRILEDEEKYIKAVEKFKKKLKEGHKESSERYLVLCDIKEIYHVTPGKLAGKLI